MTSGAGRSGLANSLTIGQLGDRLAGDARRPELMRCAEAAGLQRLQQLERRAAGQGLADALDCVWRWRGRCAGARLMAKSRRVAWLAVGGRGREEVRQKGEKGRGGGGKKGRG